MTTANRVGVLMLVGVVAVATACGNSDEENLEQLIEEQSGEDVEVDLGDGGISIESEDGSLTIDEDGNFTVIGEDGEVITGDVDVDGDSVVVQSEDGEVVIEGDGETGSVEISSDEGDVSFSSSAEIPDEWPAEVPRPTGLTIIAGTTFDDGTNSGVNVTGSTSASPVEYVESYGPMLEAAGFTQTTYLENDGNVTAFYEGSAWTVSVSGARFDDEDSNINVGVSPTTP